MTVHPNCAYHSSSRHGRRCLHCAQPWCDQGVRHKGDRRNACGASNSKTKSSPPSIKSILIQDRNPQGGAKADSYLAKSQPFEMAVNFARAINCDCRLRHGNLAARDLVKADHTQITFGQLCNMLNVIQQIKTCKQARARVGSLLQKKSSLRCRKFECVADR